MRKRDPKEGLKKGQNTWDGTGMESHLHLNKMYVR